MKRILKNAMKAGILIGWVWAVQDAPAEVITEYVNATNATGTNYFLGKVGVGTNNPGKPLHVVGDSKLEGGLTVDGALQVPKQGDLGMGLYTNGVSDQGVAASNLALRGAWISYDGASQGIYVDSQGRVGVGTNTPGAAFQVKGTSQVDHIVVNEGITLGGETQTAWPNHITDAAFNDVSNAASSAASIANWASNTASWASNGIGNVIVLTNGQSLSSAISTYNATNRVYLLPYGTVTCSDITGVRNGTRIIGRGKDASVITGGGRLMTEAGACTGYMENATSSAFFRNGNNGARATNFFFYRNIKTTGSNFGYQTATNQVGVNRLEDCTVAEASGFMKNSAASATTTNCVELLKVDFLQSGTTVLHNAYYRKGPTDTVEYPRQDFTNYLRLTDLQLDRRIQFSAISTNPAVYTNGAQLWAQSNSGTNELYAMDGAGNITQLSTHEQLKHVARSWNIFTGEGRVIDLDALAEEVVKLSGRTDIRRTIHMPRTDWDEVEQAKVLAREAEIREWRDTGGEGEGPEPYTPQPKPDWLKEWEESR